MLTSQIFSDINVHHLLICVLCRMQYVVCIALLLSDYNGQLLDHAICLVVLFFCHFFVLLLFFERNKWRWRWRWRNDSKCKVKVTLIYNRLGVKCLRRSSFIFSFIYFFCLFRVVSWLPVSFLLHVKYTLSYRIVSPLPGYQRWADTFLQSAALWL